jgi:hypothetical protein
MLFVISVKGDNEEEDDEESLDDCLCIFLGIYMLLDATFVLIAPGSMIITLIPNGASSYLKDCVSPSKANFVATYADAQGTPKKTIS